MEDAKQQDHKQATNYKVTMLLVAIYRSVIVKKLTVMTYAVYFGTK